MSEAFGDIYCFVQVSRSALSIDDGAAHSQTQLAHLKQPESTNECSKGIYKRQLAELKGQDRC